MKSLSSQVKLGLSVVALTMLVPTQVKAASIYEHYYVGIDGLETLSRGTYEGLDNPNHNHLTFLFAHIYDEEPDRNHFHGIGSYRYTGDVENPDIISGNNRLPETYTGLPPMTLLPGTGIFADFLISQATEEEYTNTRIRPVQSLLEYSGDEAADKLYNSSGGRWQGSLGDAIIALELVSITPGLKVADVNGKDLFNNVGDTFVIGQGDTFDFTPIFYTNKSAPVGQYSAEFRLLDVNTDDNYTPLSASGTFFFDFQVQSVPEPSLLLGLGLLTGLAIVRKKPTDN